MLIKFLKQNLYYLLALALLIPALFINLNLMPLLGDESIRGLVSLEMIISGDYITPTMYGDLYFNKPPLYIWILIFSTHIFGTVSEFALRFPTVIFTFLYGISIFLIIKNKYGKHKAFIGALVFVTCGRMLFWDSMLALIDICFSWIIFMMFMVIFNYITQRRYYQLFIFSYILAAIGFLMKGLPAVAFLGITLFVVFLTQKKFKKLFSFAHILGFLCFATIVGLYYYFYFTKNPETTDTIISTLFSETTKRTAARFGIWNSIVHTLKFPFEMTYHFLPWSLFIVFIFQRKAFFHLKNDEFVSLSAITFISNIIIYWVSPEVHPRYLLMLAPLIFFIFLYFALKIENNYTKIIHIGFRYFFLSISALISIGIWTLLFVKIPVDISFLLFKIMFISILIGFFSYKIWQNKDKTKYILFFALTLLVIRIGFNWIVLPIRHYNAHETKRKQEAVTAGKMAKEKKLYIYKDTPVDDAAAFYITQQTNKILYRKSENICPSVYYLIDPIRFDTSKYKIDTKYKFKLVWDKYPVWLVQFNENKKYAK